MCANCAGSLESVAAALAAARRLLLTTHVRPDGDALGSVAALHRSASAAGRTAHIVVPDVVPRRYAFLLADLPLEPVGRFAELAAGADAVVVVDTCAWEQLEPLAEALGPLRGKAVVIDHHATADDVAAVAWRDESAAAAGVMVAELLEHLGWPVDAPAADALAAAVCTDTGWMRFPNTDARALRAVAALTQRGANLAELYERIYQSDRPQRLALLAAALSSLRLLARGHLAVMALTRSDFQRTGAAGAETEDFVNEPLRLAGVEVSVILVEQPEGPVRVSLRSRRRVDVSAVAERFGGGGHARAAGCRVAGDLAAATEQVVGACTEALRAAE